MAFDYAVSELRYELCPPEIYAIPARCAFDQAPIN